LIRTRLSIDTDGQKKPSILSCGVQIYKEGGIRGMYRGLGSTLFGITPYVGIKLASFDILKTFYQVDQNHPNAQVLNLVMGASAGTIALTCTYPTDLVRRRMQMSGSPGHPEYKNMLDCFLVVYKKEGLFKGLYKGYFAALLKVAPSVAILFWCNELLKSFVKA